MAHESRLSAIKVALKRCYLYYPCVPIHMLLRMKYSHGNGPFHWGHLPEWWRCLDRGNVLRKYAVNTKAHSSMYLFVRPVSVSVPQQNKDTFCQSNTIGRSNVWEISRNEAKKPYALNSIMHAFFRFCHVFSTLFSVPRARITLELPVIYLFRRSIHFPSKSYLIFVMFTRIFSM